MSVTEQLARRNLLLSTLDASDLALLLPHMTQGDFNVGDILFESEQEIVNCWFPLDGVCSLIAATAAGRQVEVGLIGRDGLVGTSVVQGTDRTPLLCFVQIAGSGLRLRTDALRRALAQSPAIERLLLAYAQTLLIQVAHTALANASHTIAQRLARWMLMSHDRLGDVPIRLTHERLSLMLGVRRAGVTVSLQTLERSGLVDGRRGLIVIKDRRRLEGFAEDSYGTPEAEYGRLIGTELST